MIDTLAATITVGVAIVVVTTFALTTTNATTTIIIVVIGIAFTVASITSCCMLLFPVPSNLLL